MLGFLTRKYRGFKVRAARTMAKLSHRIYADARAKTPQLSPIPTLLLF